MLITRAWCWVVPSFRHLTSLKFGLTPTWSSQPLMTVAKFTWTQPSVLLIMDTGWKGFLSVLRFELPEKLPSFMESQLRKEKHRSWTRISSRAHNMILHRCFLVEGVIFLSSLLMYLIKTEIGCWYNGNLFNLKTPKINMIPKVGLYKYFCIFWLSD